MIYTIGVGWACLPAPAPVDGGACFRIGGLLAKKRFTSMGNAQMEFCPKRFTSM